MEARFVWAGLAQNVRQTISLSQRSDKLEETLNKVLRRVASA